MEFRCVQTYKYGQNAPCMDCLTDICIYIYIYFLFKIYVYRVNHLVTLFSHYALLQKTYLDIENTYIHIHEYKSTIS